MNRITRKPCESDTSLFSYVLSFILHLLLFVFLTVKLVFFPREPFELEQVVRVDLLEMPDRAQILTPRHEAPSKEEQPPPPLPQEPSVPEAPAVEIENIPKSPSPIELESPETEYPDVETPEESLQEPKEEEFEVDTSEGPQHLIRGDELSGGHSLTGFAALEYENYLQMVEMRVKQNWRLPQWLSGQNLSARVLIIINSNGLVTKMEMMESSQNSTFDQAVAAAIKKASPFPSPPRNIATSLEMRGIILGFPE